MSPYLEYGLLAGVWLAGVVACIVAIRWSHLSARGRSMPAIVLSIAALAIAYFGTAKFGVTSTTTDDAGHVRSHFDSRWLFMGLLVLGAVALVYTIWRKWRSAGVAEP
jgi:threonine/homoserine/homoserine lactone efflux protein